MKYSFEQIKNYLTEILEKFCEPELSLWLNGQNYMIILYEDFCTFQRCGSSSEVMEFGSLDELYTAELLDGIVLKSNWVDIEKIECFEFGYLDVPGELL